MDGDYWGVTPYDPTKAYETYTQNNSANYSLDSMNVDFSYENIDLTLQDVSSDNLSIEDVVIQNIYKIDSLNADINSTSGITENSTLGPVTIFVLGAAAFAGIYGVAKWIMGEDFSYKGAWGSTVTNIVCPPVVGEAVTIIGEPDSVAAVVNIVKYPNKINRLIALTDDPEHVDLSGI